MERIPDRQEVPEKEELEAAIAGRTEMEPDGPRVDGHLDSLFAIAAVFTGLAGVVAVLIALVVIAVVSARRR